MSRRILREALRFSLARIVQPRLRYNGALLPLRLPLCGAFGACLATAGMRCSAAKRFGTGGSPRERSGA